MREGSTGRFLVGLFERFTGVRLQPNKVWQPDFGCLSHLRDLRAVFETKSTGQMIAHLVGRQAAGKFERTAGSALAENSQRSEVAAGNRRGIPVQRMIL